MTTTVAPPTTAARSQEVTTVIDHLSFPHIMDAIYSSATPAALLSLRAASRDHKLRADAVLTKHIVMTVTHKEPSQWPHPGIPPLVSFGGPHGARIPSLRLYATSAPFEDLETQLPIILGSTRILDVVDKILCPQVYYSITKASPNLATLRSLYSHDTCNPMGARCRIDVGAPLFIHFASLQHAPSELYIPPGHTCTEPQQYMVRLPTVPYGTRRAVLNFQVDLRDPCLRFLTIGDMFPATLKEMTIIFTPIHGPSPRLGSRWGPFGRIFELTNKIADHCCHLRFTIVGLAALHCGIFDCRERPFDIDQEVYDVVRNGMVLCGARMKDIERNIEFLSHDEYRERTDPAQWQLEMVR